MTGRCGCEELHVRALAVVRATATVPHLARPTAEGCDDTVGLALAVSALAVLLASSMHAQPWPCDEPADLIALLEVACDEVEAMLPALHVHGCPAMRSLR